MAIEKPVDLTNFDDANVPVLSEIISKICNEAATIRHTNVLPTASTVAEGEIVVYDNGTTQSGYCLTGEGVLLNFGMNGTAGGDTLSWSTAGYWTLASASTVSTVALGAWATRGITTVYQATTDGFFVGSVHGEDNYVFEIYSDSSNPPTTVRMKAGWSSTTTNCYIPFCCPIKKNDYYKIVLTGSGDMGDLDYCYFIPLS